MHRATHGVAPLTVVDSEVCQAVKSSIPAGDPSLRSG